MLHSSNSLQIITLFENTPLKLGVGGVGGGVGGVTLPYHKECNTERGALREVIFSVSNRKAGG